MQCLLIALLPLAALAAAAPPVRTSRLGTTQGEVLDSFFKSIGAGRRFDDAARALGAKLGVDAHRLPQSDTLLRPPWANPAAMQAANRAVNDGLADLIEKLRAVIEALAEPLKIEYVDLSKLTSAISIEGYIKDATISKLSTFRVDEASLDIFTVSAKVGLSFEKLDAHGDYSADTTVMDLHIFGEGHFDIRVYEPSVEVYVKLGYGDKHFKIEDLTIYIQISKLKVILTNFLGGGDVGDLISGIISDVGPEFVSEFREEISQVLSSAVKALGNQLLSQYDVNTIIDFVTDGGSIG